MKDCGGSLYLDDGTSYQFRNGAFLRVGFTCKATAQGLTVKVEPHSGSFSPWWKLLSIEVYGAAGPATGASAMLDRAAPAPVTPGYDAEHHRITVLVPDDGKGLEMQVAY